MLMRARGFSMVELMVAIALISLLLAAALPGFTTWTSNARIRSVADALQSGLRTAQAEAQRRARSVVFFKTTSKSCDLAAVASAAGSHWQIRAVENPLNPIDDPAVPLQCGVLTDISSGVKLDGPTTVCFSGNGRQMASVNPGSVGIDCILNAQGNASAFDVDALARTPETRRLRLLVTLGGSVRMCDPEKTQSSTTPDGCPTP